MRDGAGESHSARSHHRGGGSAPPTGMVSNGEPKLSLRSEGRASGGVHHVKGSLICLPMRVLLTCDNDKAVRTGSTQPGN